MITLNPDTDDAVSKIVTDDDIERIIRNSLNLKPGEAIQIRRADYLDTKVDDEVEFKRPKLTLIQGGNICTG